mmetsp:Transcript_4747/g.9632  ORF Transcript_4747/g.9632 Transcript_4747/m.9632 type:complete len:198 (+) Transcript_4747:189-782(+)
MASTLLSFAKLLGIACAVGAVLLLALYFYLQHALAQQHKRKLARVAKKKKQDDAGVSNNSAPDGVAASSEERRRKQVVQSPTRPSPSHTPLQPLDRGRETIKREADLKRDALYIFRRLQASTDAEERSKLCSEASAMYDSLEKRMGSGMASLTSGRIVFCNALMECGGLDVLRECKDSEDSNAAALVERVVPIIFST